MLNTRGLLLLSALALSTSAFAQNKLSPSKSSSRQRVKQCFDIKNVMPEAQFVLAVNKLNRLQNRALISKIVYDRFFIVKNPGQLQKDGANFILLQINDKAIPTQSSSEDRTTYRKNINLEAHKYLHHTIQQMQINEFKIECNYSL